MSRKQSYLLILEDDPDILNLVDTTLKISGYRVVTARNGNEGLKAVQKEHPAIVITDIMMPQLDGFGFVHRLRINPETRAIPVVVITATYVSLEDREFAENIGATRFIQKPLDIESFLKTIEEVLVLDEPTVFKSLNEVKFYEGYRERLETKLEQINTRIARDEHLLRTKSDEGNLPIKATLDRAIAEREEIRILLSQVYEQLEKIANSK